MHFHISRCLIQFPHVRKYLLSMPRLILVHVIFQKDDLTNLWLTIISSSTLKTLMVEAILNLHKFEFSYWLRIIEI